MKYKVTYELNSAPLVVHSRYYNALNKGTALEMFSATCEESLAGETPLDIHAQEVGPGPPPGSVYIDLKGPPKVPSERNDC